MDSPFFILSIIVIELTVIIILAEVLCCLFMKLEGEDSYAIGNGLELLCEAFGLELLFQALRNLGLYVRTRFKQL